MANDVPHDEGCGCRVSRADGIFTRPLTELKFTSTILPPWLRRAKSIEDLLPWLYLKGISTGDFSEALAAMKKWRKLDGQNRLPEIIQGVEFRDGIKHQCKAA